MSKKITIVPHRPNFILGLDRRIHIKRICQVTNETIEFSIPLKDFNEWKKHDAPIHKVFDYLTPDQREMMVSGYTKAEWDMLNQNQDDEQRKR